MEEQVYELLSLQTGIERREWLRRHFPERDDLLIRFLREEAYRRERDDPHTELAVARAVADAAVVWNDRQVAAMALHIEADARRQLGEHDSALLLYRRAAELYYMMGMDLNAAQVAVGQMAALMYLGRYEEALALAAEAAQIFRRHGDRRSLGKVLINWGNTYARIGRFDAARKCYAEAKEIFVALGDARHLAMVNVNDANTLAEMGDFRQAGVAFREARAYFESEGMTAITAQIDLNLGNLAFAQGDYQAALQAFERTRRTFLAQHNSVGVAYVDLHRSEVYLALNLWHEALEVTREARRTFESAGMQWEVARLWLNETAAQAHLEGGKVAIEALERARRLFAAQQNSLWLAMTDLYQADFELREGRTAQARQWAQSALEVFSRRGWRSYMARCEVMLGRVALEEGQSEQAAQHFERAMEVLGNVDIPAISYACFAGLARAAFERGDLEAAKQHYHRAISRIERLQSAIGAEDYKMAFLSDKLQVYEEMVALCLQEGTKEAIVEAFETVEGAKSRALLETLARSERGAGAFPAEVELLERMDRLKRELNWYYNRLNDPLPDGGVRGGRGIFEEIARRERELESLLREWRSPDLASTSRNPVWTVSPDQLQEVLPEGSMVLEFYRIDDQVLIFGVERDTMWSYSLETTYDELEAALARLRFQMNKFSYGPEYRRRHRMALWDGVHREFRWLYERLIAPIADRISGKMLFAVPHGVLHYIPFHALWDGCSYLIETKTIAYAPSATVLYRLLTQEPPSWWRFPLILGVPDRAIPYAGIEVESLGRLFPNAEVRYGLDATVEALRANEERPAFLHLATHATFRADNPLFSALRMADGWVNVIDLYEMAASAPLVTLSACETGRSQVAVGDELLGLCRGFFSAGAQALVVSLWMVDDTSTARLMQHFYEGLADGESVGSALRGAQLAIKEELPHPYYWAPFIAVGNVLLRLPLKDLVLQDAMERGEV